MAILDRLFPTQSLQARKTTGIKTYSETPGVLWERPVSSSGVHVDEKESLSISAVFAAVYRLANIAAMLPVGIYRRQENGRREEVITHPAVRPLAIEANVEMTAFTARHFMQFWKPLFGSAVAEIGWDGAGRPRSIWPLHPCRVYPDYDDEDQLFYRIDTTQKMSPRDMIYIPHVTEDGVTGKGFVHYALESLGQAISADRAAGRLWKNNMRPGGLLKHPGNPTKEARKTFRDEWALAQGGENQGKVGVLWGGWEWVKEGGMIDPADAQLLESRQYTPIEVARWINVPPHWVSELGRATWGNVESLGIEALIYTVGPMLEAYQQEFDRKLLDPPRLYCKYNVNALLRADSQARGEFYRLMRDIGVYSVNDILSLEDQNGIGPEGDRRFVAVNMQPLDDLMTGGEAQRRLAEMNKVEPEEKPKEEEKPKFSNARRSFRGWLEQSLSGFVRKEINEARRAAKKPNIQAWMDEFYPGFEGLMASSLVSAAAHGTELGILHGLPAELSQSWAQSWVKQSREAILLAQECRAEEWPRKSEELFASWENRSSVLAASISGESDAS